MPRPPRILMLGWEYPPFNSGGLGVACQELAESLALLGAEVFFVLPLRMQVSSTRLHFLFVNNHTEGDDGVISAYTSSYPIGSGNDRLNTAATDLIAQVNAYASNINAVIEGLDFDVIHAHDWLTVPAALKVREKYHKPLVFHIHSTEYDRTGGNAGVSSIAEIESLGCELADQVVVVSDYTRSVLNRKKRNPTWRHLNVVHNALNLGRLAQTAQASPFFADAKPLVVFVGRLTIQKGADWFLRAAAEVRKIEPDSRFIVVGSGDMQGQIVALAARLGLADRTIFTGFLRDEELAEVYNNAAVFVMPSVSEPFGITALEAAARGVPVIVSREAGVGELLKHVCRAHFWDVRDMADKILAAIRYRSLADHMRAGAKADVLSWTWDDAARAMITVYDQCRA